MPAGTAEQAPDAVPVTPGAEPGDLSSVSGYQDAAVAHSGIAVCHRDQNHHSVRVGSIALTTPQRDQA